MPFIAKLNACCKVFYAFAQSMCVSSDFTLLTCFSKCRKHMILCLIIVIFDNMVSYFYLTTLSCCKHVVFVVSVCDFVASVCYSFCKLICRKTFFNHLV
jgi:hypothetical protein